MKGRPVFWATRILAAVLMLACIFYLATRFDWPSIGRALRGADWLWLMGPGSVSIVLYWWLRALRWGYLLKRQGISIPLRELYWCSAVSLSLSILTPMQSGEALKVELLKRRGRLERLPGYASFFVERIADLAVILALSFLAVSTLGLPLLPRLPATTLLAVLIGLLVFALGLLLIAPIRRRLLGVFRQIHASVPDPRAFAVLLGLTLMGWLAVAWGWQVSVRAIGIELDPIQAVALTATVTLVNVLTMIPGAIGVSEFSAALMLGQWQHDTSLAQAGAIMLRMYALLILVLGLAHFVGYRLMSRRIDPAASDPS